eukprot:TRINITY_DN61103_c0_g1_i1.p1 TRINITY_DN61103_c0_g1~~TRINITY_DN61103_c0_g1_i1.p1  ORF type:complete len:1011 (-),score=109.38 TRINITY_DN61103_c0_g1_i1:256-3222(-)
MASVCACLGVRSRYLVLLIVELVLFASNALVSLPAGGSDFNQHVAFGEIDSGSLRTGTPIFKRAAARAATAEAGRAETATSLARDVQAVTATAKGRIHEGSRQKKTSLLSLGAVEDEKGEGGKGDGSESVSMMLLGYQGLALLDKHSNKLVNYAKRVPFVDIVTKYGMNVYQGQSQSTTSSHIRVVGLVSNIVLWLFLLFAATREEGSLPEMKGRSDATVVDGSSTDAAKIDLKKITADDLRNHASPTDLWLAIDGLICDVTEFAASHPGGAEILLEHAGREAGEAFRETGHSDFAYSSLRSFAVGVLARTDDAASDEEAKIVEVVGKEIEGNDSETLKTQPAITSGVLGKLFTREDNFNLHKALGLVCLFHYTFRFGVVLSNSSPVHDAAWFTVAPCSLALVWLHALLQVSSFIFHVPRARVHGSPMIWEEFRVHNCIFTLRHIISFTLTYFLLVSEMSAGKPLPSLALVVLLLDYCIVFGAMVLADWVTERYRVDQHESTTATMPYWDGCPRWVESFFKNYYMFAQLQATTSIVAIRNMYIQFLVAFPLQIASLLMTLVRKGVIPGRVYHVLYFGALAEVFICWAMQGQGYLIFGVWVTLFYLRRWGFAKYGLWGGLAAADIVRASGAFMEDSPLFFVQIGMIAGSIWVSFWVLCTFMSPTPVLESRARRYLESRPKPLVLAEREQVNDVLFLLKFELPMGYTSGVSPGQHVRVLCTNPSVGHDVWNGRPNAEIGAQALSRSYTPVSTTTSPTLDVIVRHYPEDVQAGFPDGGRASTFLTKHLAVGDEVLMSGPHGHRIYEGKGIFRMGFQERQRMRVCAALVGGSGVTPALSVLGDLRQEALAECFSVPGKCNKTPQAALDEVVVVQVTRSISEALPPDLVRSWACVDTQESGVVEPPKLACRVCSVVTSEAAPRAEESNVAGDGCDHTFDALHYGKLTRDKVKQCLPSPADDVIVLVCGPRGFMRDFCQPVLQDLGYKHVVLLG